MIVQEAIDLALARCAELGARVSGTKSLMIQRVSQYQQRLFALAAEWNPDYFGTCVVGTLDLGRLDLADIIAPLEAIEKITRVEIADPGTSLWLAKDEVNIVPQNDPSVEIAPRATIRRRVLRPIGTDLDNVLSLRVHYSPVPVSLPLATGAGISLGVPAPHDGLVPLDLCLYLLDRVPAPDASTTQGRAGTVAEQAIALAAFEAHVRGFSNVGSRFMGEPGHEDESK